MISRLLITQTGADTDTYGQFILPDLDGRSAYEIVGVRCRWEDFAAVAAADYSVFANVQAGNTSEVTPASDDFLCGVAWGAQNTAGVAVLAGVSPYQETMLMESRITVQTIYGVLASSATAQANDVTFELSYRIVKLTELEYLRLLAGGV